MKTRLSTRTLALGMLLAASLQAQSATTDLANAPLITDPTAAVLPNVFLLLDDSGTMGADYMPFDAINFNAGKYGIASSQCNGVYYDPAIRYITPVMADGTRINATVPNPDGNSTFTAAWRDGFNTAAGTVNLSTSFVDANAADRSVDAAQTAFYYVYSGAQNTEILRNYYDTASTFFQECISPVGSAPGNGVFTKKVVNAAAAPFSKGIARTDCAAASCTFAEESQNFANWYSYYRTRMLTMKTSAGLAFRAIGNNFRIGYASINNNTGADFLGLSMFDAAQKASWYAKLYSATPNFSSPLREALAKAGMMYANKLAMFNNSAVVDPVQYSCQQNFTILTSDGSWNFGAGFKLDGSMVGNQDGDEPRPYFDGAYRLRSTTSITETQTQTQRSTSEVQKWTEQNQSQTSNLQSRSGPLQWQTSQQHTDATLRWQSNLRHTDATLQWQSNLQHTDATLQWQSNLQHTDAPLRWQTNLQQTIQQQLWSTDQQQTTAPLQWQTKQQVTTAPLLWATNLQTATAALQWQTNLQATSGTLQKRTSQLQKQVTQLQRRTSTLQEQTSQLQSRTSDLQASTMYLQTRVSEDFGTNWTGWSDVGSCTWKRDADGTWRDCRYVTASGGSTLWSAGAGTWNNTANCNENFGTSTAAGTTWGGDGTSCRYTAWTAYTNATSCTALAQDATNPFNVGTATQCQNLVTVAYHNVASCTATTIPDGSGQTTQCQYTGWTGWSGVSSCTALAQSVNPNYTVGTATECQSVVTSAWANAAAACAVTTVPDASGNTTQCQYLPWTVWSNAGNNTTCITAAQTAASPYTQLVAKECQLTGTATAAVTTNPPACSVTYNNPGTSTSDGSGKSISACSLGAYSAWANVGGGGTCTTVSGTGPAGSSVNCQMAAVAPSYLAYGATCTNTYNAGGASTASGGGNVTACTTAGAFSTPVALTGVNPCNTSANVQCSTGAPSTAYTTYAAPGCATTYNAGGNSTPSGGLVVSACPVSGTWSGVTVLSAGQVCTGSATVQCPTGTPTTAYVNYAMASAGSCAVNYGGLGGSSTAGAGGIVTTACPTAAWTTPVPIAACAASLHVACSLDTPVTDFVTNYPPTCTLGNVGGLVTTACTLAGTYSPAQNIGAGNTCTGGVQAAGTPTWGNTVQCVTGTALAPVYVTYTANTCTIGYNGTGGTSTANASGNVITACPTTGAVYGGTVNLAVGQTCTGGVRAAGSPTWASTINCPTTGAANTYVTFAASTCTINYNGVAGTTTVPAAGTVTTACPTTGAVYGGTQNMVTGDTCTGGVRAAGTPTWASTIQCPATVGVVNTYVTFATPNCTVNYGGLSGTTTVGSAVPALSAPPAANKVITACPLNGATYGGAQNLVAGQTCTGGVRAAGTPTWGSTIQCPATTNVVSSYVTTYPPTCATNYGGLTGTTTVGVSTPTANKVTTACPTAAFSGWTNTTASCTPSATVNCQYNWGGWGNVASCTDNFNSGAGAWTILSGTSCQYSAWSAWADYAGAACPAVAQPAASGSTTPVARNCRVVNANTTPANTPAWPAQAWLPAASCTANAPAFNGSGARINCQTLTTGPTLAPSCTAGTLGTTPWTTTTCVTNTVVATHGVASCTAGTLGASPYTTTICNTTTTPGVPAAGCVAEAANAANGWVSTNCSAPSGGTFDTLADVAEYYFRTDLRTTALSNNLSGATGLVNNTDISNNNVPITIDDTASHQHMTTFTVGLGARGKMVFDPLYKTATSGDFYSLGHEPPATADGAGVCSWQLAGSTCDWPVPGSNLTEDIDDLWHTAVDGRGTYFSAKNPSDLSVGLISALANIQTRLGSAAAATTSTAFVTQGDNFLFRSSYLSLNWTGELTRQQLDVNTGAVLPATDWSAQSQLDTNVSRTIYTYDPANGSNNLKLFSYANLTGTQQGYFNLPTLPTLAQFSTVCPTDLACLSAAAETSAAGANLVNFIAGERTNEGGKLDATKYYRQRANLLGDIVDSESVYIKAPTAAFSDPGYSSFKTANTSRRAMVYVGANDGMLHAFRAADDTSTGGIDEGGQEDWAYIPSLVIPELYKLADKHYGDNHRYYVDGSPVSADICVSGCNDAATAVWKTILIGGLNHGGVGYYALDVTNPASPKALWEFTHANMGYTYGNPKVVKLADGTWVVLLTSGYNNITGDGQGHLYVLNAYTGAPVAAINGTGIISTGVGTPASPSGLSRIDAPVTTPGIDATAIAVYGGDLEGNLWRFDINDNIGAFGYDAQLLATLRDSLNNVQTITAKPLITVVSGFIVVNIGTGRYLGVTDQNSATHDSFYAIKDTFPAGSTPSIAIYGDPRTYAGTLGTFVEQTQTAVSCPVGTPVSVCATGEIVYVSTNYVVNFNNNSGWFVDFSQTGERDNTDPAIIKGTLVIATNLPSSSSCSIGGDSFLYQLDYRTGGAVSTSPNGIVGVLLGHELTSRPVVVMLQDGTTRAYTQGSGGGAPQTSNVFDNASADGVARRISWRELIVK